MNQSFAIPVVRGLALLAVLSFMQAARAESGGVEGLDVQHLSEMSLEELLQMKITAATRSVAMTLEEAPSTVTLITREEIDRYGYRTVGEALSSVPGLFVLDDYVTSNLAIRGIQAGPDSWSRTFKFMVDGKPIQYQPLGGALLGAEFIPMDAVESIEVVRGPASALYGANAFLGVVNVITRIPSDPGASGRVTGEGGMIRNNPGFGAGGNLLYRTQGERPFWLTAAVSGARWDRSGQRVPSSSPNAEEYAGRRLENNLSRPLSLLGRLGWDLQSFGTLEVESLYQRLDSATAVTELSAFDPNTRYMKSNLTGRLDYTLPLVDSTSLGPEWAQKSSLHTWFGVIHGGTLSGERISDGTHLLHRKRRNTTYESGLELVYAIGRNSASIGVDYQDMQDQGDTVFEIDSGGTEVQRNEPTPLHARNVGMFSQLIVYPMEWLGLTGSLRWDNNTLWGNNLTYRTAGVFRLIEDKLFFKALYGTSYLPPAPTQLNQVPLALDGGIIGNPNLTSQRAGTFETAVLVRPIKSLKLDATVFYTKIERRIENQPFGELYRPDNLTNSTSAGFELAAEWNYEPITIKGDVAYQKTRLAEPRVPDYQWELAYGDGVAGGSTPPNYPDLLSHVSVAAALPSIHLGGALTGTYVGWRKSTVENIVENGGSYLLHSFFLLGLNIRTLGLELWGDRLTEVSLHANNLLNQDYSHGGARGVDIPPLGVSVFLRLTQEL